MKREQENRLAQYPLLRTRCEERAANGTSIEDSIADAVNGAMSCGDGPDVMTLIKHLATAFLYARTIGQKKDAKILLDKF